MGLFNLTLLRALGAASGVLGDDSLAVSDVELREELLLDNSLLNGLFVANCGTDGYSFGFICPKVMIINFEEM